jgi:hypothetical protein
MTLSAEVQTTVNRWEQRGVLLQFHKDLLEVWEQDRVLGYPFLRDTGVAPAAQLHEHERLGNLNYAAQMRICSAHDRLDMIVSQYDPTQGLKASIAAASLPRTLHLGEDLWVSSFFADLVSALDAVAGQVVLVYGFPDELRFVSWKKLADLLSRMSLPYSVACHRKNGKVYSVMPSLDLISVVLDNGALPSWLDSFIDYRNHHTHRTFFATIIDTDGIHLPQKANILPSLVLNPIEIAQNKGDSAEVARLKKDLFNPMPLHEYCKDIHDKVRRLIEQVYEQTAQTYQARLSDPKAVVNPHNLYRFELSI